MLGVPENMGSGVQKTLVTSLLQLCVKEKIHPQHVSKTSWDPLCDPIASMLTQRGTTPKFIFGCCHIIGQSEINHFTLVSVCVYFSFQFLFSVLIFKFA